MQITSIIQAVCVLIAAGILGNWFLAELKRLRAQGKPLYAAYLTTPGIIIICIVILVPLAVGLELI